MPVPTEPGTLLPEVMSTITQEKLNRYAAATGDFNPIHVDQAFAATTPFGKTIAHGMLILAYVYRMLSLAYGASWPAGGNLKARFKSPALVGDTVISRGLVRQKEARTGIILLSCSLECVNQRGETLLTGEATVRLPAPAP